MIRCQGIKNLCALNLYLPDNEICIVYLELLKSFQTIAKNEITEASSVQARMNASDGNITGKLYKTSDTLTNLKFSKDPSTFFSTLNNLILSDIYFDNANLFFNNLHQFTEKFIGLNRLNVHIDVYDLQGNFIRSDLLENELSFCEFSFSKFDRLISFNTLLTSGSRITSECKQSIDEILKSPIYFYELSLKSITGTKHPVPVRILNLNENEAATLNAYPSQLTMQSISSDKYYKRFFLIENKLAPNGPQPWKSESDVLINDGVGENLNLPKAIRISRSLELSVIETAEGPYSILLTIIYEDLLTENMANPFSVTSNFKVRYVSSPTSFHLPLLMSYLLIVVVSIVITIVSFIFW